MVFIVLGIGVILFVGWFIWGIATDKLPQFFPLNNSRARYTIVRYSKVQMSSEKVATDSPELPEPRYYVEYRGDNVFMGYKFFRIMVGNSKIDLEPFIGKDVIITKGEFVGSGKQCIVNKCIDIAGPYAVLDIDGLKVAK